MPPFPPSQIGTPSCHFILASTSPRRREFMNVLGLPFTVTSPGSIAEVDETPLPNEAPANLVQRLSRLKAQAVIKTLPEIVKTSSQNIAVIAADTVVVFDDKILGKPATPAEAVSMLKLLRQGPHYVYSGLSVAHSPPDGSKAQMITRLHQSTVWMRSYSDAEIDAYVAGGSPLDKAGAYGIQDAAFAPVERLEGCFASVMGLPLGELAYTLKKLNLPYPQISPICSQHTGTDCCQNR